MTSRTYVLYHASCADGFGAAFAAWRHFGYGADFLPVQYGQPAPETEAGAAVYLVDFSYGRSELIALAQRSSRVVVLDHHKTAREALAGLDGTIPGLSVTFDMGKSGAVLAWEYFFPGVSAPRLLLYVQDRDLWQWRLPLSREFSAALAVEPRDFPTWLRIRDEFSTDGTPPGRLVARGRAILDATAAHVAALADKAIRCRVGGHDVPAVNSPLFQSEIGEELCRRHPEAPFAAAWFCPDRDTEVWSLRSRNGFDVSAVARQHGGGGHPAAAGFTLRRPASPAPGPPGAG